MFSFTLSQRLSSRGLSQYSLYQEVRNQFDVMFDRDSGVSPSDCSTLNGRIQVRLDEKAVRFFYYSGNFSNTLIESDYKEIAAISLVDVKETEYDILYFGELLKTKFEKKQNKSESEPNGYVDLSNISLDSLKETVNGLVGRVSDEPHRKGVVEFINNIFRVLNFLKSKWDIIDNSLMIGLETIKLGYYIAIGNKKRYDKINENIKDNIVCKAYKEKQDIRLFNFPFIDKWKWKEGKTKKGKGKWLVIFIRRCLLEFFHDTFFFNSLLLINGIWKKKKEKRKKNEKEKWFEFFLRCCFLYFIFNIEDEESSFAKSPIFEDVRNKLRLSMAYQLLCAKVKYTFYLFEGGSPQNVEDYSLNAGRFADLLMDARINEVIPRSYYHENAWFYNPEIELEYLVKKDFSSRKGQAHINEQLRDRIRDFFYSKHAVISAMGGRWEKCIYISYIILILLFSIGATICLLNFETVLYNDFFYYFKELWFGVAICAIFFLGILFLKNKSLSVFMPRVLVALSFGWLTAFISDDLIKSQLEISQLFTIATMGIVIALIGAMLWGEAKHHSPYYCSGLLKPWLNSILKPWIWPKLWFNSIKRLRHLSSWKILPIIIHSYFWSLTLGVIMQFALYGGLLKNSNALSDIVYKNTFDKAENYIMHLTNYENALVGYRQDLDGIYIKAAISGVVESSKSTSFMNLSMFIEGAEAEKFKNRSSSKVTHITQKFDRINAIVEKMDTLIHRINTSNGETSPRTIKDRLYFGQIPYQSIIDSVGKLSVQNELFNNTLSPRFFDSVIKQQLNCLDGLIDITEKEIQDMKVFVTDNNKYDTLIAWSCNPEIKKDDTLTIGNYLEIEAIDKHYLSREVRTYWFGTSGPEKRNKYIFPRMLILHTLIVLIIAFVGQLVISDKSVTEPL